MSPNTHNGARNKYLVSEPSRHTACHRSLTQTISAHHEMRLANAQQNQSQPLLSLTRGYELQALGNTSHCPIHAREGGGVNVCVCNAPTFKHGN